MKKSVAWLAGVMVFMAAGPVGAHFGMLIPSKATVSQSDPKTLEVQISFSHPFEMNGMDMAKPKAFGVMAGSSKEDLLGTLKPIQVMGKAAWSAQYSIKKPGVYIFYVDPEPYWEPAEDTFIMHYTKVVVPAFGDEEGWDKEVGQKIEIVPLTRPFGLYAGNVFQGIVKVDGKPLPVRRGGNRILQQGSTRLKPRPSTWSPRSSKRTATVSSPMPLPRPAGGVLRR